jgi:glycine/D-amino acid oxidase-like deaminating enzyme
MDRSYETVIIGGGIAGLAAARQLHDNGRSFLLITENVGGRIRQSADGKVNLGAYYVRSDYDHVNRFVDRGRRIKRREVLRGNRNGSFTRGDLPLLKHPIQALRFLRLMREFRHHYEIFKQDCLLMSQAQAIREDQFLWDLYHQEAPRFARKHGIEDFAEAYLGPGMQGTGFTSMDRLSALTLLVGALPTIIPIFEYTFRFDLLTAGFEDDVLLDSVTGIDTTADHYLVQTRSGGRFSAANVVVATPIDVSARLLDLGNVKGPVSAHMFLIRGSLRQPWERSTFSLFREGDEIFAIARQTGGSILFTSASEDPDFSRCFSTWEVIEHHHWNPAFHLEGDTLLECERGPGVYLVGDHNVCDLEDAYITGAFAANSIIANPAPAARAIPRDE